MGVHRLRIVAGLSLALVPMLAGAQTVPRGEAGRGVTVQDRPRGDFDPLGVRLGAFNLAAAANLGLGWDDNLFGTRRNRVSDGFTTYGADASLFSNWTTHLLGVTGRFERRSFFNETEQDRTDYAVAVVGRYDLTPDTAVEGRLNRARENLDVTSFDVQGAGIRRPVPYDLTEANGTFTTRFNRIGVLALANWRAVRFQDFDTGPAVLPGQPRPGDVSRNDFDSALAALGLTYEIGPGRFVNLITRFQDISFKDSTQRGRDSQTWEALVGFTYDFDGVWAFRAAVGYRERSYDDPRLRNLAGPAFEGTLTYQPTLLTTFSANARRTIEESIRLNSVSFTRTQGSLRVDHEYLRNVILSGEVGVDRREFEQPSQQATDGFALLSARWLINRNFSLIASYQHARRLDASQGFQEFDRNLFQLRLRASL